MTKLAPEWVRTSDPVIRSPARYRWTTAPAPVPRGGWRLVVGRFAGVAPAVFATVADSGRRCFSSGVCRDSLYRGAVSGVLSGVA